MAKGALRRGPRRAHLFYYPKGGVGRREVSGAGVRLAGPRSEGLKGRIAPALLRCRLMYTCRGQQPAVLAVGLALLFELAFQGLDAVPHLGYERIASRSRPVGGLVGIWSRF